MSIIKIIFLTLTIYFDELTSESLHAKRRQKLFTTKFKGFQTEDKQEKKQTPDLVILYLRRLYNMCMLPPINATCRVYDFLITKS